MKLLAEYVDGLPNICGDEAQIETAMAAGPERAAVQSLDTGRAESAFAIALHMHQPLIPAGGEDLQTARLIGNLQWMMEHPDIGDNHNAPAFHWCYKRMGELI